MIETRSKEEILADKREFFCLPNSKELLNFREIFGNDQPVRLEIGSGKGEFISLIARENPEINFLGLEMSEKRVCNILRRIQAETHRNVRLGKFFVNETITEIIPAQSIGVIYIQHPDPWPKRKHFKHRLIQHPFLDAMQNLLRSRGEVRIATDHPGYAKWIMNIFQQRQDYEAVFENGYTQEKPIGHISTFFEQTWEKAGFKPYFMFYRKKG